MHWPEWTHFVETGLLWKTLNWTQNKTHTVYEQNANSAFYSGQTLSEINKSLNIYLKNSGSDVHRVLVECSVGSSVKFSQTPLVWKPEVLGSTLGGSPGSCCSRWRSSRAASTPTARCWSPPRPCRPGWGPRWPSASAGCPRSGPDGRQLKDKEEG